MGKSKITDDRNRSPLVPTRADAARMFHAGSHDGQETHGDLPVMRQTIDTEKKLRAPRGAPTEHRVKRPTETA
jgi:hypothetical protein